MSKKFNLGIIILLLLSAANIFAGIESEDDVWQKIDDTNLQKRPIERISTPMRYSTFRLNKTSLQTILTVAPQEKYTIGEESEIILTIPMPDGTYQRFAIKDSPIMEDELAAKYPEIKTYIGQGIDNPTATTRFDLTPQGFHAIILSDQGTIYVDPYAKGDTENYISYKSMDVENSDPFVCLVGQTESKVNENKSSRIYTDTSNIVSNGTNLRQYRLALAGTAQYTAFHGGVSQAMSAMTTTMNRVNGIYEREIAVRMIFIANNSNIIFTNTATDGYTNGDPVEMLGENQEVIDNVIGTLNYDIGHVFGTIGGGGSGVAFVGVPCNSGFKAQGVSLSSNPGGESFNIQLVAHEMGHQFGSDHTFNGNASNCFGNRSQPDAYETASGSTIMAYAGICSPQNIQLSRNDYFHVRSLETIVSYMNTQGTCSSNVSTGNAIPTVSVSGGTTFNIPKETPFSLTATGTDGNGDILNYAWEEYTLGPAGVPDANVNAPMFRSYLPVTSPIRFFPSLQYILNNNNVPPTTYDCGFGQNCLTAEVLSSISRTMTFQVTARDNRANGGGVNSTMANVIVTSGSGPFKVTAQDSFFAPDWSTGSRQTISWSVANTTAAPVSAANVDIFLSTDGGQTFPFILANNTPNDGSQTITVPNGTVTTQARIKVQGSGNIFFDINNVNFNIVVGTTAASAAVSGRVVTSSGRGISRTFVKLTDTTSGETFQCIDQSVRVFQIYRNAGGQCLYGVGQQ